MLIFLVIRPVNGKSPIKLYLPATNSRNIFQTVYVGHSMVYVQIEVVFYLIARCTYKWDTIEGHVMHERYAMYLWVMKDMSLKIWYVSLGDERHGMS